MGTHTILDAQGHENSRNASSSTLILQVCVLGGGGGTNIYPLFASLDFCHLLVTFANSLDPDMAWIQTI